MSHDDMPASNENKTTTLNQTKPKNPFRIKLSEVCENEGFESREELLEAFGNDSVMPACCSEGCQVEPDGRCEHGCPSILLAMGVI